MWKGSFWILTTWLCSFQLENYYFNSSPVLIQYFWNIQINQTFADLIQHRSILRQARENMQPGLGAERTLNNNVQQTKEKKGITSLTANGFSGRLRRLLCISYGCLEARPL